MGIVSGVLTPDTAPRPRLTRGTDAAPQRREPGTIHGHRPVEPRAVAHRPRHSCRRGQPGPLVGRDWQGAFQIGNLKLQLQTGRFALAASARPEKPGGLCPCRFASGAEIRRDDLGPLVARACRLPSVEPRRRPRCAAANNASVLDGASSRDSRGSGFLSMALGLRWPPLDARPPAPPASSRDLADAPCRRDRGGGSSWSMDSQAAPPITQGGWGVSCPRARHRAGSRP